MVLGQFRDPSGVAEEFRKLPQNRFIVALGGIEVNDLDPDLS